MHIYLKNDPAILHPMIPIPFEKTEYFTQKSVARPVRRGDLEGYEDPQYAKKVHIFCILYADIVDQ